MFKLLFRAARKIKIKAAQLVNDFFTFFLLKGNAVVYGRRFKSFGVPVFDVWKGGKLVFGDEVVLNNGYTTNLIGRQQPCIFIVRTGAELTIGNNTGISATAIVCSTKISIGNYVKIGGNTVIYDTDFHSLDADYRTDPVTDAAHTRNAPVIIGDHVFIGAHSTILKGLSIGTNSIIGSGSVVTRDIPANEIWAGNPAKFIRNI